MAFDAFRETTLVQDMKDRNKPVRAILNGVYSIRRSIEDKNGETEPSLLEFLPKEEKESKDTYNNRMLRTYVTPYLKNAIHSATGQIFKNPIIITEPLPEEINDTLDNVDLQQTDFNEWLMRAKNESFAYGMVIGFVDFINPSESDNLSDQQSSGARPFLKQISYFDLLGYNYDDQGRITMMRFLEEASISDPMFGMEKTQRVRVVTPTEYFVFEESNGKSNQVDQGEIIRYATDGSIIDDHIPVAVMYDRRLGVLNAASVFEDLAYINMHHTQVNSDLSWAAHFYLIPFLITVLGDDAVAEDVAGAFDKLASYVNVTLPRDSDIKWVETNGKAHESGMDYLKQIEARIQDSSMDTSVAVSTGARETATGQALQADSSTSKLKLHAEAVESFAKSLLEMMASYYPNIEMPDFDVVANKEFALDFGDEAVKIMREMVNDGHLTLSTLLTEMKRRNIFPDTFDVDKEIQAVEESIANSVT